MDYFLLSLLLCSWAISLVGLLYIFFQPLIKKHCSSRSMYYAWLPILLLLIIPLRLKVKNPLLKVPYPIKTASELSEDFLMLPQALPLSHNTKEEVWQQQEESLAIPGEQVLSNPAVLAPEKGEAAPLAVSSPVRPNLWQSLFIFWLIGMLVYLSFALCRHIRFIGMTKRWRENAKDTLPLTVFTSLKKEMGIKKNIPLYICPFIGSPMMIGFKNSTILLPDNNIAADKLYFVLKHELVHFKRKDLWYKSLVILTSAIHWFNPLMPLISKNVHVLCEVSCDDEIVKNTDISTRCQYSETIVDLIKNHSKQTTLLSTSFTGGKKGMKKRITSIMDTSKKKFGSLYWDYDANLLEKQIAEKGWGQFDSYEIAIDIYDQPLNSINDSGSLSETRTKNKIFGYVEKTGVLLILRFHDGQVKFFGPYDTKEAFKEELIPYFNRQITDGRMNQEEVDTIMLSYERPESMFSRRDIITKDQVNTAFYQDKIDSSWYYLESQTYYQNLGFNYRHIKAVGRDTVKTPDVPSQIDGYDLVIHFDLPDDIKDTSPLVKGEVGYLGPYKTKAELLTHATIYLQDQVALKKLVQEEANNILAQLKKEKTASELLIEEIGRPNTAWYKARMGEDRTFHIRMYRYNQHGNFIEKTNDSYHVNSVYSKSEQPETYDGYALDIEFKNDSTVSIGPYNTKEEFVSKTAFYLQEQVLHKKLAQENMNMILNEIKE